MRLAAYSWCNLNHTLWLAVLLAQVLLAAAQGAGRAVADNVDNRGQTTAPEGPTNEVAIGGDRRQRMAPITNDSSGGWVTTGTMTTPRADHTATLLLNGKVLVAGGRSVDGSDNMLASAELYDPATGVWTTTGSMTAPRGQHTATLLLIGKVLVTGGCPRSCLTTSSAELYDPDTGVWSQTGSMSSSRGGHAATLINSGPRFGEVLVTGGYINSDDGGYGACPGTPALDSTELYDLSTGNWSLTGSMTIARCFDTPSPQGMPDGSVLVVGGLTCCPYHFFNEAELYDQRTQTWMLTGGKATPANGRTALMPNGQVLVAGGESGDQPTCVIVADTELFDFTTGTWAPTASMSIGRSGHSLTLLRTGKVLAAGGASGGFGVSHKLSSTELYDPSAGTWSRTGSMKAPRRVHTATLLHDGRVLVAGGLDVDENGLFTPVSSAELYIPKGWTNAPASIRPDISPP